MVIPAGKFGFEIRSSRHIQLSQKEIVNIRKNPMLKPGYGIQPHIILHFQQLQQLALYLHNLSVYE